MSLQWIRPARMLPRALVLACLLPALAACSTHAGRGHAHLRGTPVVSTDTAVLSGTAQGLFRGCQAAQALAGGQPRSSLAEVEQRLAALCDSWASGVTLLGASGGGVTVDGRQCALPATLGAAQVAAAVVAAGTADPQRVAPGAGQEPLTRAALASLAECAPASSHPHGANPP